MATGDEIIRSLREALNVSPDNVPLRQHLADTLLIYGRPAEAEAEYRLALKQEPLNQKLHIGLVRALFEQDKIDSAITLVEDVIRNSPDIIAAETFLLYARLLLQKGEMARARKEYLKAIDADPSVADPSLAEQLRLQPDNEHLQYFHPENEELEWENENTTVVEGRIRLKATEDESELILDMERPAITFEDVGGMDKVKDDVRMKIIHPLTHPEIYAAYGKAIGGGILMYGPPGCGKTHLARATAGEVKAKFIPVGINDVLDMWLGNSERNLHQIFEQARRNTPCVLFFDEVDALGASRTDMRHSAGRHIINQFLSELDGIKASNEGVLILGATNAPWHLDSAFRRPGRFDRIIFVPPPDQAARAAILRILLKGKPAQDVDHNYIAKKAKDFSGADLKAVVDLAVEEKLREAMKQGIPTPLATRDLQKAINQVKPSTKEWFATARNYALYANQGGLYDDILEYLRIK